MNWAMDVVYVNKFGQFAMNQLTPPPTESRSICNELQNWLVGVVLLHLLMDSGPCYMKSSSFLYQLC